MRVRAAICRPTFMGLHLLPTRAKYRYARRALKHAGPEAAPQRRVANYAAGGQTRRRAAAEAAARRKRRHDCRLSDDDLNRALRQKRQLRLQPPQTGRPQSELHGGSIDRSSGRNPVC